uniref:C1q domain-containing protein n=1 Tax=Magallana gigas TaxID=29159 RepID=A0A8W8JAN2_MAGGI|nr:heavy metal-binding protein HIP [Crassostrea gigas]
MVWISLVLACVYFALNSPVIAFPEKTETLHGNQNWKLAMKKIEELQKIVRFQEDRINSLEKRREEPAEKVIELQRILKNHCGRITQLETRVIELESTLKKEKEPIAIHPIEQGLDSLKPTDISNNRISVFRKERLLNLQPTSLPMERVAFYAYLSTHDTTSSAIHHIIVFDKVITNVGNAYHPHSGTFIAPRSGLYVFTWTIRQHGTSYHVTEFLVDNNIVNVIYMDPGNVMSGSVTGTVVVHVNQGDDVLVRTGSNSNNGQIISDNSGRSAFAGWNLM